MKSRLTLAGVCLLAAFGLAACGGGGGTTASTGGGGTMAPTGGGGTTAPPATPLETAVELDGRLDDVDVGAARASAIESAGKLTAESVKGDSAMAMANAQAVVDANAAIHQAIMDADEVIKEANAAKMEAEDIEDATEKAAVIGLLDAAIAEAQGIKTAAQAHIDEAATDDGSVNTLGEAVAAVENPAGDDPAPDPAMTAANAGEAVADQVRAALGGTINDGSANAANGADAVEMNDSAVIGAMTWAQVVGEANLKTAPLGTDRATVMIGSIAGMTAADVNSALTATGGEGGGATYADGHQAATSSFNGIPGTAYCLGSDCMVGADGTLVGSWYFTPTSPAELYVAGEGGSYSVATMYVRYGYWLSYEANGSVSANGVTTFARTTGNTAGLNLIRGTDATADVTARYSGSAVGIAVRNKASGEFAAKVNLTATFGDGIANSNLSGHISGFTGGVADPNWRVMLNETGLTEAGALNGNGIAYGGAAAGQWTAQGYGPAVTPAEGDNPEVNHRPTGFFGRFNANFNDGGAAAGAYTTRVGE
ncbi:MAG: hypothetical protein OXC10_05945 [Rhodospirillaceae bacterium]|nr:hypothetical protein [Rhodospirillaceae bacterium]